jgi:hypothetical protein
MKAKTDKQKEAFPESTIHALNERDRGRERRRRRRKKRRRRKRRRNDRGTERRCIVQSSERKDDRLKLDLERIFGNHLLLPLYLTEKETEAPRLLVTHLN